MGPAAGKARTTDSAVLLGLFLYSKLRPKLEFGGGSIGWQVTCKRNQTYFYIAIRYHVLMAERQAAIPHSHPFP